MDSRQLQRARCSEDSQSEHERSRRRSEAAASAVPARQPALRPKDAATWLSGPFL